MGLPNFITKIPKLVWAVIGAIGVILGIINFVFPTLSQNVFGPQPNLTITAYHNLKSPNFYMVVVKNSGNGIASHYSFQISATTQFAKIINISDPQGATPIKNLNTNFGFGDFVQLYLDGLNPNDSSSIIVTLNVPSNISIQSITPGIKVCSGIVQISAGTTNRTIVNFGPCTLTHILVPVVP